MLVELLKLLSILDLILEPTLHDLLPDFFNAADKERLKLIPLLGYVYILSHSYSAISPSLLH